jgi:transcriptional regulator with XRE-family HTH domain
MNVRLEEVRNRLNLTKKEFADRLDITANSYTNYIQGKRQLPSDIAIKISETFNISIDWLLTGKGKMFLIDEKELKIINGNNNNVVVGGGINKSFNTNNLEMEKSIIKEIVNTLNKVHDDNLLNYINSEITALINRIQTKEKYGSTFGG